MNIDNIIFNSIQFIAKETNCPSSKVLSVYLTYLDRLDKKYQNKNLKFTPASKYNQFMYDSLMLTGRYFRRYKNV